MSPNLIVAVTDDDWFNLLRQQQGLEDDSLIGFPSTGRVSDFHPGIGRFETDTFAVPMSLGGVSLTLRCGSLPALIGTTLMMADTRGIMGNEVLVDRVVRFLPRRRLLCL